MRVHGKILTQLKCYTDRPAEATVCGSVSTRVRVSIFKKFETVNITAVLQASGIFSNADRRGAGSGRLLNRRVR